MSHHRYLIIGGGMAADAAVRGIREVDPEGAVALLTREAVAPYDRPPLTKGLWKGQEPDRIWRGTSEIEGVRVLDSRDVLRLEPEIRTVTDDRGVIYTYDRLLLATGGTPRRLEDAVPQVIHYRTLDDYRALRRAARPGAEIGIVGGGFIGAELGAALAEQDGVRVTLFLREPRILERVLPEELALEVTRKFADRGVRILAGSDVASVRRSGDRLLVSTRGADAQTRRFDAVAAGLGIEPASELAETAGLETDDGIVVDSSLRTSDPDIFAAGDVAAVWSTTLGRRLRIEHEEQANASGRMAGRAMAGADVDFDPIPFLYSDLFDDGFEAIGELGGESEVQLERGEGGRAIAYFTRGSRLRGILFWNIFGRARKALPLLREPRRFTPEELRALIPLESE